MPMSETRLSGVKDVPLILWVDAVNGEVDWHPGSLFDSKYAIGVKLRSPALADHDAVYLEY